MNVKELITKLQKYDSNLTVVFGHESDYGLESGIILGTTYKRDGAAWSPHYEGIQSIDPPEIEKTLVIVTNEDDLWFSPDYEESEEQE